MKEEALKLADELQDYMTSLGWKTHQAPAMIRRLVEELDKQGEPIAWMSPDGKVSQTEGKLFHIPLYAAPKPDVVRYFWVEQRVALNENNVTNNLKLTFDGETGELKSAEVLK